MLILFVLLISTCTALPRGDQVDYEVIIKEFLRLGEAKDQVVAALGSQFEELIDIIYGASEQDFPVVSEEKVRVLSGPTDPDSNPNFNPSGYKFGGADELFEKPAEKPKYGGNNDRGKPRFGGKNDPEKPVFGGKGDPDHRRGSDPRKQSSKDSTREDMPNDVRMNECDKEVSKHRLPRPYPLEKICADIECPAFDTVDRPNGTCGFEIRTYGPGKWVMTSFKIREQDGDLKSMTSRAFRKLFKYIKGANNASAAIPMTAPVQTRYRMTKDSKMPSGGVMMFYVPAAFQANVPVPTDPEVSIVDAAGNYTCYVRAFGGRYPSPDVIKREFKILGWKLYKAGIAFNKKSPVVLGYSAPWDRKQRHEVVFSADRLEQSEDEVQEVAKVQTDESAPAPYPIEKLCAEIECPPYTVIPLPAGASGFEMRRYTKANWVMTQLSDKEVKRPEDGMGESFMKLFAYIQGQNEDKEKVPMTAPVVTVWEQDPMKPDSGMKAGQLQFYIPAELQDTAPVPTGPGVQVESQDEVVVMVRAMGGIPPAARYKTEFMAMYNAMTNAGLCGDWSTIITAGYTAPWDPRKRTELMVPQSDC